MMKKYVKGLVGIFIFVLLFMMYTIPVYAAGLTTIKSYICPNDEADPTDSADNCITSMQDFDYDSLTEITSSDTVPVYYSETDSKKTIIVVEAALDVNDISNIAGYNVSYYYDVNKLQLIYADKDLSQFPAKRNKKGIITENYWTVGIVYGNLDGAEVYGSAQEAPKTSEVIPGVIKIQATTTAAGSYLLPYTNAEGPFYTYLAFEVKDDASGSAKIGFYEESPKIQWDQLSVYNSGTISGADINKTTNGESEFTIGNAAPAAPAAITKLEVYSDSTKAKLYPFGVPGSTYGASSAQYNDQNHSYDLYLPAGTTSIYIHSEYTDGATVSGDIGTKLLSSGSASFVVTGTVDGTPSVYTITYHVPNNKLSGERVNYKMVGLTSDGSWVSVKDFSPSTTSYNVYLTPTQAASVAVSAKAADTNGGLETKFNSTTKTAKTQTQTVSETLSNVKTGDTYTVTSYGADCFGDYYTAMGSTCSGTTYTITYKVIDRTFSAVSIVGVEDSTTYGISSFSSSTPTYTVYVPASVSSVKYGATATDPTVTGNIDITDPSNSKALTSGSNTITLVGETNTGDEDDTYTVTYTITVYKLSDDATLATDGFTSSVGTLSHTGTDTSSTDSGATPPTTTNSIAYNLNVGSSTTSTDFTITPNDSTKAYLGTNTSDHGGSSNKKTWNPISTTTPYTIVVNSESCDPQYASVPNNTCNKTSITVNATKLSSDTSLAATDGITVRNSETGSTYYTVNPVTGKDDEFTVTVPSNQESVYVVLTPNDLSNALVETNGTVSLSGTSAGGTKLHTITVKAEDRTITKDYKISIHKASTAATLTSFTMTDGTNPVGKWNKPFVSTDTAYSAIIENTYTEVKMSAETTAPATLNSLTTNKITNDNWDISGSSLTYTVTVKSESCQVTGDTCNSVPYTLTLTKKSPVSKLTKIALTDGGTTTYGEVTPVDGTTSYTIAVPAGTTGATIVVTKEDSTATVSGDGAVTGLSTASNPNVQTITSTSEYGTEHQSVYSLNIYVLTDDKTVTLTSSNTKGTLALDTEDNADGTKYTLTIPDTETSTNITATAHTTSYIGGTSPVSNTQTAEWKFSSATPDTYSVTVYPERCKAEYTTSATPAKPACTTSDGKTYTITKVLKSTSTKPSKIKVVNALDESEVYGEIDFTQSPAPEAPYKINIPADAGDVKIVVDKVGNQTIGGDTAAFTPTVGNNNKTVTVTSEAGGSPESYTINVYKPSSAKILTALTFSKGELDPTFAAPTGTDAPTTSYTLKISEVETGVKVNATASTNAYINDTTSNILTNADWTFSGNNTYTIKVFPESCKTEYHGATACTDSDATVYTITLQTLNNEKNLTSLKVNGVDAVADGTDKYKVYLKPSNTTAEFTCTASDSATCAGDTLTTLSDGSNPGSVTITAEDGSTKGITVDVYRVSDETEISALTVSEGAIKEAIADGTYTYTGRFSDKKTTTGISYTAKYNGFIDEGNTNENATVSDTWSLEAPVSAYTFTVKSESCKDSYSDAIKAECKTKQFTVNYEAINSAATLASLSVKDQNGTEYFQGTLTASSQTVYVPSSVTQYTVSATKENSDAELAISPAQPVTSVIDGDNPTVTITVTPPAGSGSEAQNYTVTVHRLSDAAVLTSLTSSAGTLNPSFPSSTTDNYYLDFTDDTTTSTNISATANSDFAKLTINSDTSNKKTKSFTDELWNFGDSNTFTIKVESEACGYTTGNTVVVAGATCTDKTYTITKRVLSNSTTLADLTVKNTDETTTYTLDPVFSTSVTKYKVDLPNGTTTASIIITPGTNGPTISGQSITSGGAVAIDSENANKLNASGLVTGDNKVTINLKAQDNTTTGSYEVTLHVKNNAKTLGLTTSVGTLTEQEGGWKLTIPSGSTATQTTFTATIPSGASITMGGTAKTEAPYTADWTFSDGGTYEIVVTPEDGEAQTYTVTCEIQGAELSDDNSLTALTANNGTITAVDATNYKLEVPYGTSSSDITATIPAGATLKMNGSDVTVSSNKGTATWSSYSDGDTFEIIVKSEKGTPKTYTLTVDIGDEPVTSTSTLHSITVTKTGGTETYTVFDPEFIPDSAAKTAYTVYVPYPTDHVDVSTVATDTSVTPVLSENTNVLLAEGGNNITISVTSATDSTDTTVYTLTVYRLCNNTDLGSLTVSTGALNETFSAGTTEYTIFINNSYPQATVTATLPTTPIDHTHGYINSEDNTSNTFTWNFEDGTNNEFTLQVYSESCKAAYSAVEGNSTQCHPKTYKITATFFADKITSDTFGLKLETFNALDIIADARVGTTGADLKGEQTDNPAAYLELYRADGTSLVPDTERVATGMILRLIINGTKYDERTLVVPGDANGDSEIDIYDLLVIVDHILDTTPLTGPYLRAGDVNDDNEDDIYDLLGIVDIILS